MAKTLTSTALALLMLLYSQVALAQLGEMSGDSVDRFDGEAVKPNDSERIDQDSFPDRSGLYMGLDPGFVLADVHANGELPKIFRINLRVGWCFYQWMHFGMDFTLDFVADDDGFEQFDGTGPKLLQPMLTFVPVGGLMFRVGPGWDPYVQKRWALNGYIGYEFEVGRYGGVGVGLMATHLFHTGPRDDWQLYGLMITFTGYNAQRGFGALGDDPF